MGTGYVRNDSANNIADGNVINAADLDGEFDAVQSAFNASTGHSHDGTTGEGPQITSAGLAAGAVTASAIANDSIALGTKTTGNYVSAGAVSGVGLSGSASAEGATFTVTSNATDANTASTIVARDASGDFSAGTITADLTGDVTGNVSGSSGSTTGNAATATALATGRTIGMTGDVVWTSAAFDGSGNVTGTATIQPDSVALGTDTTGNYVATGAVSGTGLSGSSSSEGGTFTVTSNATDANTASTIVSRDGSGNFSAGTITANLTGNLTGNAATATQWQTTRTITLSGDVTSSATNIDGSGNVSIATTLAASGTPSGTKMLFQQTAAPTGWTKDTTHNDKAIRIVNGTVGTGGSTAFATALGTPSVTGTISGSTGAHTLTTAEMPSHVHNVKMYTYSGSGAMGITGEPNYSSNNGNQNTDATGGGGSHSHSLSATFSSGAAAINVQYVDVIIATKD
jgi:hypothetical protein